MPYFVQVCSFADSDAGAVGTVFVDDRYLEILRILAELGLGVLVQEGAGGGAVLIGVNLRAEHVVQVLALEHARRRRTC